MSQSTQRHIMKLQLNVYARLIPQQPVVTGQLLGAWPVCMFVYVACTSLVFCIWKITGLILSL